MVIHSRTSVRYIKSELRLQVIDRVVLDDRHSKLERECALCELLDHAVGMPRRIEGGRQLKRPSYDHERESRSQNDQRIYASDHDAEINVGHEILRLELSLPTEHRGHSSPQTRPPKLLEKGRSGWRRRVRTGMPHDSADRGEFLDPVFRKQAL
jgi:hypothetical protein